MCQLGCVDVDPNPDSLGRFLGSGVTDEQCTTAGLQTDTDQDGLSDFCEKNLAAAFAPWMRYFYGDDVSHEGFWAARPITDGEVRVFYALGYYVDLGVFERMFECKLSTIGEILAECDGHHGDSEYIVLDLQYNASVQHWVLVDATYSHHNEPLLMPAGINGYASMIEFKDKVGGAPIAWVAQGKHANYPTQRTCDEGGGAPWPFILVFDFDICGGNDQWFRAASSANLNLGSNDHRLSDCLSSVNPFYQDPPHPQECFWSGARFYGWDLDHSTSSTGYGTNLREQGF